MQNKPDGSCMKLIGVSLSTLQKFNLSGQWEWLASGAESTGFFTYKKYSLFKLTEAVSSELPSLNNCPTKSNLSTSCHSFKI